jgi:TruD family tRNA pseudouridine synthase
MLLPQSVAKKKSIFCVLSSRCHASSIAYAGTKDRRGKTSQLCCIKHKDPKTIFKAASRLQNIYVGNFSFKPDVLKLGHLRGNRFRIVLRQITADEHLVEESLKSVQEKGFLNYYGLQRFGNCQEIPTYEIGKALLRSNFKEAVRKSNFYCGLKKNQLLSLFSVRTNNETADRRKTVYGKNAKMLVVSFKLRTNLMSDPFKKPNLIAGRQKMQKKH